MATPVIRILTFVLHLPVLFYLLMERLAMGIQRLYEYKNSDFLATLEHAVDRADAYRQCWAVVNQPFIKHCT